MYVCMYIKAFIFSQRFVIFHLLCLYVCVCMRACACIDALIFLQSSADPTVACMYMCMYVFIHTIRVQASLLKGFEHEIASHIHTYTYITICMYAFLPSGCRRACWESMRLPHINTHTYITICMYAFIPTGAQASLLGVSSMRLPHIYTHIHT